MIDRNHPAVEAAARAALAEGWTCDTHEPEPWGDCPDCTASHLRTAPKALTAALPLLTADDLRHTPAGRALLAEGWGALIESMSASGEFHDVDLRTLERLNPYRKEAPNE